MLDVQRYSLNLGWFVTRKCAEGTRTVRSRDLQDERVVFVHTFLFLSPESRMSVSKSLQLQFLLVTRFMRGLTLNASKLSTRSSLVWCFEERGFGFRGRVGV